MIRQLFERRQARQSLTGPDLVLLVLAAPTVCAVAAGRVDGVTRLEKLLFLVTERCAPDVAAEPLRFEPWDYGPYSRDVYEAVLLLEHAGLIREDRVLCGDDLDRAEELLWSDTTNELGYERRLSLTDDGTKVAAVLAAGRDRLMGRIGRVKDQYAPMPLPSLLFRLYSEDPGWFKRVAA